MKPGCKTSILPGRRRICGAFLIVGACLGTGLGACAAINGPRTFTLNEADLNDLVAKHFPSTHRLGDVADVTLSAPRIWLLPERNRLATSFELGLKERLFGHTMHGRVSLDSALRLEPSDDSIRLTQVRVQELQVDGSNDLAQRIGALLAERVLENLSIYRLKPEQADRLHRAGYRATAITVTSRGVEVTLGPA